MSRVIIRWFIGPWPFFPWVIFPFTSAYFILQSLQLAIVAPTPVCRVACVRVPDRFVPALTQQYGEVIRGYVDPVLILVNGLLVGGVAALVAWSLQRLFCGKGSAREAGTIPPDEYRLAVPSRLQYLLGMLILSLAVTAVRLYVFNPLLDEAPEVFAFVPNTIRMFMWLTVIQSVSGQLTERTRRVAQQAEELRAEADRQRQEAERQRQLVLEADEAARREVAGFLHDRVQADLLVIAVQLERLQDASPAVTAQVTEAVREIERIRNTDVRAASRRLSPDFEAVGLSVALAELSRSWHGVMDVRFTLDSDVVEAIDVQVMTACYRIIEQALLNAAAHGHAQRVEVDLTAVPRQVPDQSHPAETSLVLRITDDGRGMAVDHPAVGRGGSIVDAWVTRLGGSWSWGNVYATDVVFATDVEGAPTAGVGGLRLQVTLPLA